MRKAFKRVIKNISNFFNFKEKKEVPTLLDLVHEMEQLLDSSESQSVQFEQAPSSQFDLLALAEGAQLLENQAKSFVSKEYIPQIQQFLYKAVSIQYRLEAVNGGTDPLAVQPGQVNILKSLAKKWKEEQVLIENKALTENEIYQLQVTSQYPEFIELVTQDDKLMGKFFRWIIRDKNEAKVFIEYPALCEKITASNLSSRIGRINSKDLKVKKVTNSEGCTYKIVTLPFEGIDRNILDGEATVTFRGNYKMTISEVFKVFEDKDLRIGNLEYLGLGITNWNCHKWGFWSADKNAFEMIDLNHRQWWRQLPVFEVISRESAQQRYRQPLDGQSWCLATSATRGSATLDYENTHAFLEVAVPFGDGRYAIYDFGKFAKKFPATFFEGLSIFCYNLQATISYPDGNVFYSHRQQTFHAFVVDECQGKAAMEHMKTDMMKGMENNLVYQIESDNCAKWVHEVLEGSIGADNVPDMFRMHLLDTEPQGPVASIFNCIKKLPECMQTRVLTLCHLFLGASKQTWIIENGMVVCKSLTRHEFWKNGVVYLPALLHKKVEQNVLEGLKKVAEIVVRACYSWIRDLVIRFFKEQLTQRSKFYHISHLFTFGMLLAPYCSFLNIRKSVR